MCMKISSQKMKISNYLMIIIINILFIKDSLAIREARPTPIDSRIRILVYNPDDVFKFVGYYGYQAFIEFAKNEEIVSVSMGDTTAWQIVPKGNRIFLKPIEQNATTNMTLITNKRTYFFELYGEEAMDIRDPDMIFAVRFLYPDEEDGGDIMKNYKTAIKDPDLAHSEKYNFNYTISGNEDIAPIKIFDDGEFTYLQFRDKNSEFPALFAVDEELRESLLNYRISQSNTKMVVIEQVYPKLSLRLGKKITCVFNETYLSH